MAEGMFNYTDPRLLRDAYVQDMSVDAKTMAQLPLLNQIAAFGGNSGAQIGTSLGRLFGGTTPLEAEQNLIKDVFSQAAKATNDPMERMKIAAQGFREKGMEGRAMQLEEQMAKMAKDAAEAGKLRAETKLKESQANWWEKRPATGGVGGGSTQLERMTDFVSDVQFRLQNGQEVSEQDRIKARNYADALSKNQFFEGKDGSIVSVPKNNFGAIQEALAKGYTLLQTTGSEMPTAAPVAQGSQPTAPSVVPASTGPQGARVIQTPQSQEAATKKTQAQQASQILFDNHIGNIQSAIDLVNKEGRWASGYGSVLSVFPETAAGDLKAKLEQIDSNQIIEQMQALKAASPTGSTGFGSLTNQEGQRLIDLAKAIRQNKKPETLVKDLEELKGLMVKLNSAKTGTPESPKESKGGGSSGGKKLTEAVIQRVMSDPRNAGKSRAAVEAKLRSLGYN